MFLATSRRFFSTKTFEIKERVSRVSACKLQRRSEPDPPLNKNDTGMDRDLNASGYQDEAHATLFSLVFSLVLLVMWNTSDGIHP
jgi:hypothetical protein